ncbi:MAG: Do family serine endopeptidase [Fibrobacteres bacterium]|nr:Do family serine endopeptidase [Fibrobacterota bacterium]
MQAFRLPFSVLTLALAGSLAASGVMAKEAKEDPRPKRGSLELGKGKPAAVDAAKIEMLNGAFGKVVEAVSPCVVAVNTEKKWSERDNQMQHPFFEFFGIPNQQDPQQPDNSPKRNIPLGGGSGFIVNKQGYVFTNAHVVEGADIVKVSLINKKTYVAKVVGVDKKADVAVLKITAPGEDLPVVAFGDTRKLAIGEWVLAIGNPFGLQNTVTSGIVSAKGRRDQMQAGDAYQDFIQTDAAVNPGNSGGPLVNLKGEVIGINSSIYTRTGGYMGVSFAIPINMAVKVAEDLIFEGKVTRGYLGIGIDNVSENLAEAMGLPTTDGCLVREVMKNGPAAKSGLKEGDIILKVQGLAVQDAADLRNRVADLKPGDKYDFEVLRDGKRNTMGIKIGAKPEDGDSSADDSQAAPEPDEADGSFFSKKLGIHFGPLDKETRVKYAVPNDQTGLVVTGIADGSSAAENGMVEGMVIANFKRQSDAAFQKVDDPKKLLAVLKSLKAGEKIAFKIFYKGRTDFIALQSEE